MTIVRRLGWFTLAAVTFGCSGETSTKPSSPHDNGCTAAGVCPDMGNAGGSSSGATGTVTSSAGGATSTTGGTTSSAGGSCTSAEPTSNTVPIWANWSMPNPASSGLPNPAKYDSTQPEVVIDEVTGLMWSKKASPAEDELSFDDALTYCAELKAAGHCDWRLPTRIELVSLVDFTRLEPAAAPGVFDDFPEPTERLGWSFFTSSASEDNEWRLLFLKGTSVAVQRGSALQGARARCVRIDVERELPESRYVIEGEAPDDTVTDRGTGLTWQRRPSSQTYSLSEAQEHCSSLGLQGGGWRLPSMKELQTIVDEMRPSPAVDPEVFPDLPQGMAPGAIFRTSSPSAECPDTCAWLMRPDGSMFDTAVDAGLDAPHHVRCVR